MMSIDHQKNHFKRSRDEIEEGDISKDQDTTNQIIIKKRKLETSNDMENNNVLDQSNTSVEFQQKMYKSYIKSALDALDNNVISIVLTSQFILPLNKTNYHHELMKFFLNIIPTSIHYVHNNLVKDFPNKHNGKNEIINYVSNLLKLNEYCSELRYNVWSLIIEHCIQIDVELQNELDELDDDEFDDEEEDQDDDDESEDEDMEKLKVHFEDEDSDDSDSEDEDYELGEEINEHALQAANIEDLQEKLDNILSLVFENLQKHQLQTGLEEEEEKSVILYNTLTSLFKSHILPTYYTKSTQFILFYFTQRSPELMDSFLVTLIDLSFSQSETIEKRIKALQYLSSYISRANNLHKNQIVYVLSYLMSWLNRYVERREEEVDGSINMERFKLFYSTFQVLLYIFCFRHSILKNEDDDWELEMDKFFQRILITKFNPLKYCNENVVLMFAKIAQQENVAYCFSIIQKNKNEKLKGISGNNSVNTLNNGQLNLSKQQFVDLEGYFPFDPLFLKNSKKFLKDYYIEWSSISKEYESDTDDFDDLANDAKEAVIRRNSMNQNMDSDESDDDL
ncbi:unnamed protein product [Wickerhamomyces anomalus]